MTRSNQHHKVVLRICSYFADHQHHLVVVLRICSYFAASGPGWVSVIVTMDFTVYPHQILKKIICPKHTSKLTSEWINKYDKCGNTWETGMTANMFSQHLQSPWIESAGPPGRDFLIDCGRFGTWLLELFVSFSVPSVCWCWRRRADDWFGLWNIYSSFQVGSILLKTHQKPSSCPERH